ncbi:gamma-glutamyltransferase family protein [Bacteroidota bacterium]
MKRKKTYSRLTIKVFKFIPVLIAIATLWQCKNESEHTWHALGKGGAVAAGGKEAVEAGIAMLKEDGNAADAASATLLALSITDYGKFAIGAEIPLLIYDQNRSEVKVLCGLGVAPLDTNAINWYYENGIPSDGSIKAAPVPGAFGLCVSLIKLYGTMTFEQVVSPSLDLLDTGEKDWYAALAKTYRKLIETEKSASGTREEKLQAVWDRFYKGDIADTLEAFYIRNGGFLRKSDFMAYQTRVEDPVKINYRGYTVYKCPTWTQGPYLCQTLKILEGFDLKEMGHLSPDYIHVLTEALKLGFADRDAYYGDPLFTDVPIDELLSERYAQIRRKLIDMNKASKEIRPGDPINMKALKGEGTYQPGYGGTTTCVVADKWGNMIAATPSGNPPYAVCEELGIAHGNRLRSLNTTPGHPNRIEPGKRPRITLTPTLVTKGNKPVLAISVAGGDLQDQTTLNCLLNHIEFGMMPKDAVTTSRFSTGHQQNSFNPNPNREEAINSLGSLRLNEDIDKSIQNDLKNRGHDISTTPKHLATPVMIYKDPDTDIIYAAGDYRAKRHAGAIK